MEATVRQRFEGFRLAQAQRAEESWRRLAEGFRDRTQDRVNAVRAAAADIFQVELPHLAVPQVAEERERYFYLFCPWGPRRRASTGCSVGCCRPAIVRRRLLERARRHLAGEFDKHAGGHAGTWPNAWTPCAGGSKWPWRLNWSAL